MKKFYKKSLMVLTALTLATTATSLIGIGTDAYAGDFESSKDNLSIKPSMSRFRVTIINAMAGNGLSPFLAVALAADKSLFTIGRPASLGIALVAESGDTSTLEQELVTNKAVISTAKAPGGPVMPTQSRSVEIQIPSSALASGATLNLVSMIGMSNDSFVSVNGLSFAEIVAKRKMRISAMNYDAGSEENTGNIEDFGPAGHPTAGAEGHVSADRGLNPRGNAPEIRGWGSTAAIVIIEHLK